MLSSPYLLAHLYLCLHSWSSLYSSSGSFFLHKGSLYIAAQNSTLVLPVQKLCRLSLSLSSNFSLCHVIPIRIHKHCSSLQKKNHLFYCILHQLSSVYPGKPSRDLYTPCLPLISCHSLPFRVFCLSSSGALLNLTYDLHFSKSSI